MIKKYTFYLFLLFYLFSNINISHAVWNGSIDLENKRAVSVHFGQYTLYCSSGFLYSPRIVFTAAHVLHPGDDRIVEHFKPAPSDWIWVGMPNAKIKSGTTRIQAEKIFISDEYKSRDFWTKNGNRVTRINDFAVIILKKPIFINDKKVELLTPELHQSFIDSAESVKFSGYGATKSQELGKSCDNRQPYSHEATVINKNIYTDRLIWTSTLNVKVNAGMPNTCDGDSGSGYIKHYFDKYIYLGAVGSGGWQNHNCGSYEPFLNLDSVGGADPVYLFKDLIAEAEKYVADNPYIENKKNIIICIKNKTIKKIIAINPACPAGFKKK
jgi:hypothetical protein